MKTLTVALIIGENCVSEANSIRQTLEYFGANVITYYIGRPNDFITILNGEKIYSDVEHLIFCFHGKSGKFEMPKLAKDVYENDEPKGNFGVAELERFVKLRDKLIITTACSLGRKVIANVFLKAGNKAFIGAKGYIEGNSALFFVIQFYYGILTNQLSEKESFSKAILTDNEMKLFKFYE